MPDNMYVIASDVRDFPLESGVSPDKIYKVYSVLVEDNKLRYYSNTELNTNFLILNDGGAFVWLRSYFFRGVTDEEMKRIRMKAIIDSAMNCCRDIDGRG